MRVLPVTAEDAALRATAGARAASQITLPAGRSLVVVTRRQGAGPYKLAFVGT